MNPAEPPERLPFEQPLGARVTPEGRGVEFRVWAPTAEWVSVRLPGQGNADHPLADEGFGTWSAVVDGIAAGEDYWYVLDGAGALPDPASRWQPDGLRGPSRVTDVSAIAHAPGAVALTPPEREELVLYELHVGTFTAEGTFDSAVAELGALAELGITAVEVMPVAEFPGTRGWGYDGVYISATQSSYGGPEAFARFVVAAHSAGLAVILDVVYNHLGASGTPAIEAFGPYFTGKYETPWGRAINYDDADCDAVREWVLQSAEGWIRDFRVDGLRLDAIHAIVDGSAEHLVAAVVRRVRAAQPRALVIAESGMNDPRVMRGADRGGFGCDAAWADDFHHALRVPLTGYTAGYYAEFGRVADLAKALHRPHVHDGTYSAFRRKRFGAPAEDIPPAGFVVFAQNHDQVGNRAYGDRLPVEARPLAAFLTLLSPFVPMLFMGEEYGEEAPFQFFTDHIDEEIAVATREGRRREFAAFAEFGQEIPDPQSPQTFAGSKLTRQADPRIAALYRELLAVRRELGLGRDGIEAQQIAFDGAAGWLRFEIANHEVLANLSNERPVRLVCKGSGVRLATHDGVTLEGDAVELPPHGAALVR